MIYLDTNLKSLMITLAGAVAANQMDIAAHFYDSTPQDTTTLLRGGVQTSSSNNTTDVTIVATPGVQGRIRNIHTLSINNKDTATATVTVKIDDNGVQKVLVKQSIAAGESLTYEDRSGWTILSPITPPFIDTTEIVKGSLDSTKRLRIEVDGVTSGTARVWTVADADIMPCGHATGLTNTRVPYATGATGGLLTDSANLVFDGTKLTANTIGAFTLAGTIAGGGNQLNNIIVGTSTPLAGSFTTLTATGTVSLSPANLNVTASPTGTGTVTINPATLGNIDNTRIGFSTRAAIQATTGDFNSSLTITGGTYAALANSQGRAYADTGGLVLYGQGLTFDFSILNKSGTSVMTVSTGTTTAAFTGAVSVGSTLAVTGHTTFEGVTSTGATGTGNLVYSVSPTFTGTITANQVGLSGPLTVTANSGGGGQFLMSDSAVGGQIWQIGPGAGTGSKDEWNIYNQGTTTTLIRVGKTGIFTATGTITASNGLTVSAGALTVTGTGPHAIGGATSADISLLHTGTYAGTTNAIGLYEGITLTVPANGNGYGAQFLPIINKAGSGTHPDFATLVINAPTIGAGAATLTNATALKIAGDPSVGTNKRGLWNVGTSWLDGATTLGAALTYGGVTLSNAVTGTGNMVLSATPTFTGAPVSTTAAVGTNTTQIATTAFVSAFPQQITASLGANVNLNNTGLYFDGPSVAQGTSGTWFASGTVSLLSGATGDVFHAKLWDGTTVIASTINTAQSGLYTTISLSGYLASPAGNIRISVKDATTTNGRIDFNVTGNSKDSTISAFKVAN